MTAKRDFKRVVRQRMAQTGETYTEAHQALNDESVARIEELLQQFANADGDLIDREHLIIEASNLTTKVDLAGMAPDRFRQLYSLCTTESRLELLTEFLTRDALSIDDQAWAYEERLNTMAMPRDDFEWSDFIAHHEAFFEWVRINLADTDQARAFCTTRVWWRWEEAGRGDEIWTRMRVCLSALPRVPQNRQERLFLTQNLLYRAARDKHATDTDHFHRLMREIIDEPGDLPPIAGRDNRRLAWEGIWRQSLLVAAADDAIRARSAATAFADWIRAQNGEVDWLLGEIAALCLFQGHYPLAEQYAAEALAAGQGTFNSLIYAWRAGGHLGATGDVPSTVPLLQEARRHNTAAEIERLLDHQLPFTEHADDQRLREVARMRQT